MEMSGSPVQKHVARCKAITKVYEMGRVKVDALKGISYDFEPGFTLLVGQSGSGKSTLLNIIGGLDAPTSGSVSVGGVDLVGLKEKDLSRFRRQNMGFIFQSFSLIGTLSVQDNVEYPLYTNKTISPEERKERCMSVLSEVGLEGYHRRLPRALSGGQMQRVAIARALITRPSLILADEPTASLDSTTSDMILSLLEKMAEEHNTSILLASHDHNVISRIKKIVTIKDGLLVPGGTAR